MEKFVSSTLSADNSVACPGCGSVVQVLLLDEHLDSHCTSLDNASIMRSPTTIHPNVAESLGQKRVTVSSAESNKKQLRVDTNEESVDSSFFKKNSVKHTQSSAPLSERLRPRSLADFVGQGSIVGEQAIFQSFLMSDQVPSLILWGPPGCGKTTLANIISKNTKGNFVTLSAVTSGVADVKKVAEDARIIWKTGKRKTLLFLDEIHRFNRAQQDVLLPLIEQGTLVLLGATTENPSFSLNAALLSRCRVFVLQKLSQEEISNILNRALSFVMQDTDAHSDHVISTDVLDYLATIADGDARAALNLLEILLVSTSSNKKDISKTSLTREEVAKIIMGRQSWLYDKSGEEHYNIISALHKSMRGGDENAAIYWLMRMLVAGEDPLYISRRLIRFASEDVGVADNGALSVAIATHTACQSIGMPECEVNLAHCTVYLSRCPKSIEVYEAMKYTKEYVKEQPAFPVPLHLRNAPTRLMKDLHYGEGYKYTPHCETPSDAIQDYLPTEMKSINFFNNTRNQKAKDK